MLRAFHHTASIIAHVQSGVQSISNFWGAITRARGRAATMASVERRSASEAVAGTSGLRPGRSAGHQSALASCSSRSREWTVPDIGAVRGGLARESSLHSFGVAAGGRRVASTAADMIGYLSRACLFIAPPTSARALPHSVCLIFLCLESRSAAVRQ